MNDTARNALHNLMEVWPNCAFWNICCTCVQIQKACNGLANCPIAPNTKRIWGSPALTPDLNHKAPLLQSGASVCTCNRCEILAEHWKPQGPRKVLWMTVSHWTILHLCIHMGNLWAAIPMHGAHMVTHSSGLCNDLLVTPVVPANASTSIGVSWSCFSSDTGHERMHGMTCLMVSRSCMGTNCCKSTFPNAGAESTHHHLRRLHGHTSWRSKTTSLLLKFVLLQNCSMCQRTYASSPAGATHSRMITTALK